jgi:hypothetical protein
MLKQVVLLKRRDGMTLEEFRDYYENHHAKLASRYLLPLAKRYIRRYVKPEPNPITGLVEELDFDVVMEIWWESRADFETTMAKLADPEVNRVFREDEAKIFNSHHNRVFTVEEQESDFGNVLRD